MLCGGPHIHPFNGEGAGSMWVQRQPSRSDAKMASFSTTAPRVTRACFSLPPLLGGSHGQQSATSYHCTGTCIIILLLAYHHELAITLLLSGRAAAGDKAPQLLVYISELLHLVSFFSFSFGLISSASVFLLCRKFYDPIEKPFSFSIWRAWPMILLGGKESPERNMDKKVLLQLREHLDHIKETQTLELPPPHCARAASHRRLTHPIPCASVGTLHLRSIIHWNFWDNATFYWVVPTVL